MKNKILSLFATVALAVSCFSTSAFASNVTLTASVAESVKAGSTAVVDVKLESNPGIASLNFTVTVPNGFIVDSVDTSTCALPTNSSVVINATETGKSSYTFDWMDMYFAADYTETGSVIKLTVSVPADAVAGNYPVKITQGDIYSSLGDSYTATINEGTIIVTGDNDDGKRSEVTNSIKIEGLNHPYVKVDLTREDKVIDSNNYWLPDGVVGGKAKIIALLKYTVDLEKTNKTAPHIGDIFKLMLCDWVNNAEVPQSNVTINPIPVE